MDNSIKSQAFSGVKWSVVSRIYTTIASVLQIAVLTRFLAKEDFGLMGIAVLINAFCSIFTDMGMSTSAMHEQNLTKPQISSFYWFNLLSGLVLAMMVSAASPLIASFYHREELVGIISLSSISVFLNSIVGLQRTLQQKQMNFRFMSLVDILSSTVAFVINVVMAIYGFGVYSLVWAQLLSGVFASVAYLFIAIFKDNFIIMHLRLFEIREALQIGMYQVGTATLDFVSREMDSFIISSNMSMEIFGVYTLFKNLTMKIYQVINPVVTNVLTPIFAKIQEEKDRLSDAYKRTVEILSFIDFPIYGIVAVCSYSIISILYGDSYRSYAFVLSCLAIYYAFQSCGNPIGSLLIATGRTDRGFYWTIYRIVFTFAFLTMASMFSLNMFVVFVVLMPLLTAYPSWYILLRVISTIKFRDYLLITLSSLFVCIPLFPLFFVDCMINMPIVSLIILPTLFLIGYYFINRIFRSEFQKYFINLVLQFVKR